MKNWITFLFLTLAVNLVAQSQDNHPVRLYIGTEYRLPQISYEMAQIEIAYDSIVYPFSVSGEQLHGFFITFGVQIKIIKHLDLQLQENVGIKYIEFPIKKEHSVYYDTPAYLTKDYLISLVYRYKWFNKPFSTTLGYGLLNNGAYFYLVSPDNIRYKFDARARMFQFQQDMYFDRLQLGIGHYFTFNAGFSWNKGYFGYLYATIKYNIF